MLEGHTAVSRKFPPYADAPLTCGALLGRAVCFAVEGLLSTDEARTKIQGSDDALGSEILGWAVTC